MPASRRAAARGAASSSSSWRAWPASRGLAQARARCARALSRTAAATAAPMTRPTRSITIDMGPISFLHASDGTVAVARRSGHPGASMDESTTTLTRRGAPERAACARRGARGKLSARRDRRRGARAARPRGRRRADDAPARRRARRRGDVAVPPRREPRGAARRARRTASRPRSSRTTRRRDWAGRAARASPARSARSPGATPPRSRWSACACSAPPARCGRVEDVLASLRRGGFTPARAIAAYRLVIAYARGYALSEIAGFAVEVALRRAPAGDPLAQPPARERAERDRLPRRPRDDPRRPARRARGGRGDRTRYVIADVFTDTPLEGNPVAVFTDADRIRSRRCSDRARAEPVGDGVRAARRARAPTRASGSSRRRTELPFAGHPVLGSAVVLDRAASAIALETGAARRPGPPRSRRRAARPSGACRSRSRRSSPSSDAAALLARPARRPPSCR